MKILSLMNKVKYEINEEQAANIARAVGGNAKYIMLGTDMIMVSSIVGIHESSIYEEAGKEKSGQFKCSFGIYHQRYDKCFGHDRSEISANNRLLKEFEAVKTKLIDGM